MSCCCLVFFKQKTAYEVRISDWSSDVCSSDLLGHLEVQGLAGALQHLAAVHRHTESALQPRDLALQAVAAHAGILQLARQHRNLAAEIRLEIGRASCRERVCQYV